MFWERVGQVERSALREALERDREVGYAWTRLVPSSVRKEESVGMGSVEAAASSVDATTLPPPTSTESTTTATDIHTTPQSPDSPKECICPLCLGLLQHPTLPAATEAYNLLQSQSYPTPPPSFLISASVPPQLATRSRAFHLLIEKELREVGVEYVVPGYHKKPNFRPKEWRGDNGNSNEGGEEGTNGDGKENVFTDKESGVDKEETVLDTTTIDESTNSTNNNQVVKLASPQDPIHVKEVLKFLLSRSFSSLCGALYNPDSPLSIEIEYEHTESHEEFLFMATIPKAGYKFRRARSKKGQPGRLIEGNSFETLLSVSSNLSLDDLTPHNYAPPQTPTQHCPPPKISILSKAMFLAGRYNKFQRNVSHSLWTHNGQRLAPFSVEESISDILDPWSLCTKHNFASAGREDADVLMLGPGRPFYMELVNPKKFGVEDGELRELERRMNEKAEGRVWVRDLQVVSRRDVRVLKDSADTKRKAYVVYVRTSAAVEMELVEKVSALKDLELEQQTPTRVSQRRADMTRLKTIHSISITPSKTDPTFLKIHLETSAGTYVKEFVHSDEGRTNPSLKGLLGLDWASVERLDVVEVMLDWPEKVEGSPEAPRGLFEGVESWEGGEGKRTREEEEDGEEKREGKRLKGE
ncbi:putative tRNA pseudouridine synthase Pus10 [Chytridiales sp. JEL 0842]|nr:putative tRNA pseudouridine synthase Pus10 [Chytridiales sp. JEL 0842]